jgi:hypothetical protein
LATLILLDPLVAVALGATVLQEQLRLAPVPIALGLTGVVLTSRGIWMLAQAPNAERTATRRSATRPVPGTDRCAPQARSTNTDPAIFVRDPRAGGLSTA